MTAVLSPTQASIYLQRALTMLEKPGPRNQPHSWIQNAEAIRDDGTHCKPEDERAAAWCTIGVVRAVTYYDPNPTSAYTYLLSLLNMANPIAIAQDTLPQVNDYATSFTTVQNMFRKAINLTIRFGG